MGTAVEWNTHGHTGLECASALQRCGQLPTPTFVCEGRRYQPVLYPSVKRPQTRTWVPYMIALSYFKTKYSHSKTKELAEHRSHLTSPLFAYPVALETRVCSRDKLGEGWNLRWQQNPLPSYSLIPRSLELWSFTQFNKPRLRTFYV